MRWKSLRGASNWRLLTVQYILECMIDDRGKSEGSSPLDASAGLYHEAQADGFPYDDEPRHEGEESSRS